MKILSESIHQYLGIIDGWHAFMSRPSLGYAEPEIVLVPSARYRLLKGGEKVFSRVKRTKITSTSLERAMQTFQDKAIPVSGDHLLNVG